MFDRRWVFPSRPHSLGHLAGTGTISQFPQELFAAIFPDDCRICGDSLTRFEAFPVCQSCIEKVQPIAAEYFCERCGTPFLNEWALDEDGVCRLCVRGRRGFDACFSFGSYDAELRDLIHLFKYGRVQSLARPLGVWMLSSMPRGRKVDCVVPVPMHWWKRWRRGFNQAESLAMEVSRAVSAPLRHALRRQRHSGVQAGLSSAARRRNALASFSLAESRDIAGSSVLLVDDVFTTGATATACARLLKRAGADSVAVLTLARVDRRAPAPLFRANAMQDPHARIGDLEMDETEPCV